MPFYPNLPDPNVQNPIIAGAQGLGAGMALRNEALRGQAYNQALQDAQGRRQALQEFGKTRSTEGMWQYSPETALEFEKQLMSMDEAKRKQTLDKMTGIFAENDKALPWFMAAPPAEAAKWWPQYVNGLKQAGLNIPQGMENFNPEMLKQVYQANIDMKTAAARVAAASRERVADIGAESRERAAGISAGARTYAADTAAEARRYAADVGANKPAKAIDPVKLDQWRSTQLNKIDDGESKALSKLAADNALDSSKPATQKQAEIDAVKKKYQDMRGRVESTYKSGRGGGAASAGTNKVYNRRTGKYEYVTDEQFRQIQAMQGGGSAPAAIAEEDDDED